MAKVTGPLLSMSASGTVGKALVFGSRLGQAVVRRWAVPLNPKSDDQAEVRTKLAIPGKLTKIVTSTSTFITQMKVVTPTGQTWNSQVGKEILGTALGNYDADAAEYAAFAGGEPALWSAAATDVALVDFELNYGSFGAVDKGEQLYHMAKAAYRSGLACADTDPNGWIEATIDAFAADLID